MNNLESRIKLYYRQHEITFEKYETESQPLHWSNTYEIEFVAGGKGIHILNDKEYPINRGMIYMTRLRDYHELNITEKATIHRLKIPAKCLPERIVYSMIKSKTSLITQMDEKMSAYIENLFLLLESRKKAEFTDEIYIQECLINLIVMFFIGEVKNNPGDIYVSEETKTHDVWIYLQDNFRRKLSIADVAAAFKMNPNYLNRIFSKHHGMTLYAAIKQLRLEYATELLEKTDLKSIEICEKCGYSGDANFQRDFKKKFGMSPLQYRKAKRLSTNDKVAAEVKE